MVVAIIMPLIVMLRIMLIITIATHDYDDRNNDDQYTNSNDNNIN